MPTAFENSAAVTIREVFAAKLPRGAEGRLGLKLMPVVERNETNLIYERHKLLRGLQGIRGVNGPTTPAHLPGYDQFKVAPGRFGDHFLITENDLENRRPVGDWMEFDSNLELTARATTLLNQRYYDRIEYNVFTMLTTGALSIMDNNNVELYYDIYDIVKSTASPAFSSLSTATPLAYFRALLAQLETGVSVSFRGGEILMNRVTLNVVLGNQNPLDTGGLRLASGANMLSVDDVNKVFMANDLPTITVYDEGYYPEPEGTGFQKFIPNGKAILIGKRADGEPIGEYTVTRAAQNANSGPGVWFAVRDRRDRAPARIIIETGHNGGAKIFYPEGVCALTLY